MLIKHLKLNKKNVYQFFFHRKIKRRPKQKIKRDFKGGDFLKQGQLLFYRRYRRASPRDPILILRSDRILTAV